MENSIITITRGNEWFGVWFFICIKVKVYVDDVLAGKVGWNTSTDLSVEPGNYTIHVEMCRLRSGQLKIQVGAGQRIGLRVTIPDKWYKRIINQFHDPYHYFGLKKS
jgi:hypothetical protein